MEFRKYNDKNFVSFVKEMLLFRHYFWGKIQLKILKIEDFPN